MIRIFIGYDPVEAGTFYTLAHSIHTRCSQPVSITPVSLENLRGVLTRERDPLQSNDFSFSRFLVPWMCDYEGWAIFMDCDMLVQDDIAKLWAQRDDAHSVKVVKHKHTPLETTKYLGHTQTKYSRKNWSSVMLMNCEKCSMLTPELVNHMPGLSLHQFSWLHDSEIGELPKHWNHLVGYDEHNPRVSNIHYTTGGPYFKSYRECDYNIEWFDEQKAMNFIQDE